jgi:cation diffusion facilitator CzcD-associated flavoprotein CzcO
MSGAATLHDLLVLGAGPVGLEAALAASEAGLDYLLLEAGERVGANVRAWGHVRLFSPWDLNASPRMRAALARAGVALPSGALCPTGHELARHLLEPLARLPGVAPRLRLGHRVVAVGKAGLHKATEIATPARAAAPFRVLVETPEGEQVLFARAVLDCSGSYELPLWLGDGGVPAPGERALGSRIVRRLPDFEADPDWWGGRAVLLVGSGHSAQTAAVALAALADRATEAGSRAPRVTWALRRDQPEIAARVDDPLPERAALHGRAFELIAGRHPAVAARRGATVDALRELPGAPGRIRVRLRAGGSAEAPSFEDLEVDDVLALVGTTGERALYAELHVHECYATCGPIKLAAKLLGEGSSDCLAHGGASAEVLSNPEPGFFLLGSKSYGRNSAFLLRAGYEQVAQILPLVVERAREPVARNGG